MINEAMASELPVLSSSNVGAAEELVIDGSNGWRFDPGDRSTLVEYLLRTSRLSLRERELFGKKSYENLEAKLPTKQFGEALRHILDA